MPGKTRRKKSLKKKGEKKPTQKYLTQKELDQWMMSFSHEFRTPLNSILTFSDIILSSNDGSLSEEVMEFISVIHKDGMRLLRFIEKTILLVDLEQGQSIFEIRPVQLLEIFNSVMDSIGSSELASAVTVNIPKKLNVKADVRKLENLIRELLENAMVHGKIDKPILVTAKLSGKMVEMRVENSMPAEHKADPKKVIRKFVQGNEGDLTAKPPGIGVGLAICTEIAKAFKGKISCKRPAKDKWVVVISIPKSD